MTREQFLTAELARLAKQNRRLRIELIVAVVVLSPFAIWGLLDVINILLFDGGWKP